MIERIAPLLLGVILAAYWWKVLRMARRVKKQTGHGANMLPPEPVGRVLRLVWYPVVTIWVAHPLVLAFADDLPALLAPLWRWPIVSGLAVGVALLAYVLTRRCWRQMGKAWRMGIDPGEKNTLIVTGPFARVRHPIYALSSLLMLASMMVVPTPLMLTVGLLHLVLLQWEARREEAHMTRMHGDAYVAYMRRTGRFLPSGAVARS